MHSDKQRGDACVKKRQGRVHTVDTPGPGEAQLRAQVGLLEARARSFAGTPPDDT